MSLFSINVLLRSLVFLFPLYYLTARGYRPFIFLLMTYFIINKVYTILYFNGNPIVGIIWLLIVGSLFVSSLRVENCRKKNHNVKSPIFRDGFISLLGSLMFFLLYIYSISDYSKLFNYKVFTVRNVEGISTYCHKVGVNMDYYVQNFSSDFKSEMDYLDEQGKTLGLNSLSDWGISEELINNGFYKYIDGFRQSLIKIMIAHNQGIEPKDVVWSEQFNNQIPPYEFCLMLNQDPQTFYLDEGRDLFSDIPIQP